ncbi:MAG: hypothetical protein ACQERS_14735 [Bacteroidota bacterium]
MMRLKVFIIMAVMLLHGLATAQKATNYTIDAEFFPSDAMMYGVEVSPDHFMRGSALITLSGELSEDTPFYLHGELKVDSVIMDGVRVEHISEKVMYGYDYSNLAVKTVLNGIPEGKNNEIKVFYSGFMHPSKARSISDYMHIDKEEGVFLRSFAYSLWFPVFLEAGEQWHPAMFDMVTVRLPAGFRSVITGELVSEYDNEGIYMAEWKPGLVDIFEVQCTAREYQVLEKNGISVYYIHDKQQAGNILDFSVRLKEFCYDKLRAYDDSRHLFVIEMPRFGDISSGNVIGLQSARFSNFDNSMSSMATITHEFVHPYLSIPVSMDSPLYALVVEGFPSFFQVYVLDGIIDDYSPEEEMRRVEDNYMEKKRTGLNSRGGKLPAEKPIYEITADEIGAYKDNFILSDRVWLFMFDLWQHMGKDKFEEFVRDLFSLDSIDQRIFETLIIDYLPAYRDRLDTWLKTTKYQEGFILEK